MATIYYARWILLPTCEIIQNGGISIEGNSIYSIGPRGRIKRSADDHIVNVGDLMLMPGLINMHIHLEEGVVRSYPKEPDETFASWISKKKSRIKHAPAETLETAIRLGARELLSHGITTVVDSSRTGFSAEALKAEPIRACIINEIHPEDLAEEKAAIDLVSNHISATDNFFAYGTGPYSIFSMSPDNLRALTEISRDKNLLWVTHIAESSEELQAFSERTGDLYFQITRKKGWPYGNTTSGSMHFALENNLIPDKAICIHCNYVNGRELDRLFDKNVFVVQCLQYTSALDHKPFPMDSARSRRIKLCLGTESIVYSESMDLFDELNFAKRLYPHIPAAEMLRWVTQNPADALGAGDRLGSLAEGKLADIIGVRIRPDGMDDMLEQLIAGESDVRLVIVNGEEIISDY
jgi:aminodeoxyfutalosine deaminase